MNKTSVIRARMEPILKEEVERILFRLGLTVSETIHLLYRQIKLRRGLPFDVRIPNRLTAKTLTDSKTGKNVKHFTDKEDLFRDLGL
ncbi:MAG: type II toxin-antitoxin system RelB/DinJ family antitoxin [Deltaproteobacteria bacterium]|nr:type II toxin-antitoxin system RelB/DinJ family antitoxin [Deltaproteobacteria bacterium]